MKRERTGTKWMRIGMAIFLAILTAAGEYTGKVCVISRAANTGNLPENQEVLIVEEEADEVKQDNQNVIEEDQTNSDGRGNQLNWQFDTGMNGVSNQSDTGAGGTDDYPDTSMSGADQQIDIVDINEVDNQPGNGINGSGSQPGNGMNGSGSQSGNGMNGPDNQPDTGEEDTDNQPDTGKEEPDTEGTDEKVYLGIDNLHIYEGMEQSFSDGYRPTVKDGSLELVIPYVASGKLKGDKLTVNLEFDSGLESIFELKNYLKDVMKKEYLQLNGKMQEYKKETGASEDTENCVQVYLYECNIPISQTAAPGQYSLTVKAAGYTENMSPVRLDYQIFFLIPEPEPETNEGRESETEAAGGGYVGGGGGSYAGGSGGAAEEEIIRQPKMLLESCSLAEKALEAGSTETMQVALQNRSQSQSMYNLKIVLQTESKSLKLERNSFYYEKVAPGETISLEEKVGIDPDAEAGAVGLTFSFEYEDKKGTSATGTEMMNLNVVQPVKMELERAEIPAFVYASDTIEIPISVLNLSRTNVYNARVHLEGSGLFPTGDIFIGNMEAGSSGDGSMKVYVGTKTMEAIGVDNGTDDAAKYGAVSGKITLSYEDTIGKTHEISRDYQTEIKKAQILSLNVEEEQENGNPWWISVFAVLFLGMSVMILLLFARLRRKNILLEEARKA